MLCVKNLMDLVKHPLANTTPMLEVGILLEVKVKVLCTVLILRLGDHGIQRIAKIDKLQLLLLIKTQALKFLVANTPILSLKSVSILPLLVQDI